NGIAADKDPAADPNASIGVSLRIEQAVVVHDDVAADVNLVRVSEHDILAEYDVPAAGSEEQRIEYVAQYQSERTGTPLRDHDDQFMADKRREAGTSNDERDVLFASRDAGREQLFLSFFHL